MGKFPRVSGRHLLHIAVFDGRQQKANMPCAVAGASLQVSINLSYSGPSSIPLQNTTEGWPSLPALHLYARQGALRLEGKQAFCWNNQSLQSSQLPSARKWNGRPLRNLIPKYSSSSDKHANTLLWRVCARHATVGNKLLKLIFHRPVCARRRQGRLRVVTARTVGFVCAWSHPECNWQRRGCLPLRRTMIGYGSV